MIQKELSQSGNEPLLQPREIQNTEDGSMEPSKKLKKNYASN